MLCLYICSLHDKLVFKPKDPSNGSWASVSSMLLASNFISEIQTKQKLRQSYISKRLLNYFRWIPLRLLKMFNFAINFLVCNADTRMTV